VQYSINSHFMLTADAVNLTDSREFTYANVIQDTETYRDVGRRYAVGIRGKYRRREVNGRRYQSGNTADMVFGVLQLGNATMPARQRIG
jgi:hypothetical protein